VGAVVAGEDVGSRPDQLLANGLEAEVEERAASVLAAGEILELLAPARVGLEDEHDGVGAALAVQQNVVKQLAPFGDPFVGCVPSGAHVAGERAVGLGLEMEFHDRWATLGVVKASSGPRRPEPNRD
jgi:hypothetical protein